MKFNRRGQFSTLNENIILVISAILIIVIAATIYSLYIKKGPIDICRTSVIAQAHTEVVLTSPLSLNCQTRFITFKDTQATLAYGDTANKNSIKGKDERIEVQVNNKRSKTYTQLNDYIVNQIIAEEARICWYQFGEAKTEVFPNKEEFFGEDDDICFICSQIYFETSKEQEFKGIIEFLNNTYINKEQVTYWQYLNQKSLSENTLEEFIKDGDPEWVDELWENSPINIFNTTESEGYSIIFHKDFDTFGKNGYHILIMPTKNIDSDGVCEYAPN